MRQGLRVFVHPSFEWLGGQADEWMTDWMEETIHKQAANTTMLDKQQILP